jgi:hypothetical protein
MERKRRIIFRTESFERISLRPASRKTICRTFNLGNYKVEISQIKAGAKQKIFEAEISGFIEVEENEQEIQLSIKKIE